MFSSQVLNKTRPQKKKLLHSIIKANFCTILEELVRPVEICTVRESHHKMFNYKFSHN